MGSGDGAGGGDGGAGSSFFSLFGREIIAALKIHRIDFLDRDELPHVNATVRFGFEHSSSASSTLTY